ncbi:MAG TPA: GNAT family N-acetyltransferase [Patescibacteria group bacterium]|nr:GNAT family N-acetyltransferase [Patescibacteria group bacterium]
MQSDNFKVVDATGGDAQGISDLLWETWLETYPNEKAGITKDDINAKYLSSEWKRGTERRKGVMNARPNEHTWVIKDGERIIAMCAGVKEDDKNWIQALYVSPNYQKRGLGKKLMEVGLEWLGNEKPVMIHAASYNKNAIDFYKSFGFSESGITINPSLLSTLPSGIKIPEVELRRI